MVTQLLTRPAESLCRTALSLLLGLSIYASLQGGAAPPTTEAVLETARSHTSSAAAR